MNIENWVKDILSNDDGSTNEELQELFVSEGVAPIEAQKWIEQRSYYLNNIVPNYE